MRYTLTYTINFLVHSSQCQHGYGVEMGFSHEEIRGLIQLWSDERVQAMLDGSHRRVFSTMSTDRKHVHGLISVLFD